MSRHCVLRILAPCLIAAAALSCAPGSDGGGVDFGVPVEYHKLDNGLRVVLSPDPTAPIVTVAVYYNIGFRIEPRDRTGFAHLFEHMMFQGSRNLGKLEFIQLVQKNGGVLNGSTRFDFTNYFEIVPAHKLETMLWAEADRMRGLAITQDNLTNQQGVVKNEVKVNVLNQPYGGFPWLDLPQAAFDNWFNAHNFYGDLADLDAATVEDVQSFFDAYYAPNNAALVVVGDFDPGQALAWTRQYFGDIEAVELAPKPDIAEARQEQARRGSRVDPLANRPALAFAYRMPERNSAEYFAMGLIDQILLQGDDSRLYRALVQEKGITGSISGGINSPLGNMFNYNGPMLWTGSLFHDADTSSAQVIEALDEVIERLRTEPVDQATLDRALIKMRANLYNTMTGVFGFGRADLLAAFALFDDDPARINSLEAEFRKVTPELVRRTAEAYLRPTGRTVFTVEPGAQG
jgi:predicted Zn-dependent peptidase